MSSHNEHEDAVLTSTDTPEHKGAQVNCDDGPPHSDGAASYIRGAFNNIGDGGGDESSKLERGEAKTDDLLAQLGKADSRPVE